MFRSPSRPSGYLHAAILSIVYEMAVLMVEALEAALLADSGPNGRLADQGRVVEWPVPTTATR
jgi:hypothetical protein